MKSIRYVFLIKSINIINSISCVYLCTKAGSCPKHFSFDELAHSETVTLNALNKLLRSAAKKSHFPQRAKRHAAPVFVTSHCVPSWFSAEKCSTLLQEGCKVRETSTIVFTRMEALCQTSLPNRVRQNPTRRKFLLTTGSRIVSLNCRDEFPQTVGRVAPARVICQGSEAARDKTAIRLLSRRDPSVWPPCPA
jgi:hypothetical protein